MVSNISSALNAYQQALGRISAQEQKGVVETEKTEASFGNMVKNIIEDTTELSKQAETMTLKGIQGKADIQDVVLAVANAETALETVVAVRDTAIKAYNTIMQMPI
ncbi:MAG: flagellar hook-basal body complex protein FliE [Alphaproteobacteria bacterium]|nr:flagellar hook-basal body complex protein FliE [Alphaproteobacteria bacterium]